MHFYFHPGLDSDAKALYRRLEKRIETLTKMGGNLQKENQGK